MSTVCIEMHIDRANQITMAAKATDSARPISAFGLVFMSTYRTPTTGSSFGAGEAHDVGSFCFVGEIVDIFPVLPQGHTLVVMPAVIPIADTMRIADEERADLVLHTEVDHLASRFVTLITDTVLGAAALLALGTLELLPSTGILLATALLFCNLPQVPVALPLEGADTTSSGDHRLFGRGGNSGKMDFSEINCCPVLPWSIFYLCDLHTDMQLVAMIPDQCTRSALLRQIKRQYQRWMSLAHRQDYPSLFLPHGLSRPLDRVETFCTPGILHTHLGMRLAQLACGVDVAKEYTGDLLDNLRIQSKVPAAFVMQFIGSRPFAMSLSSLLVRLHTQVPDLGCFHLSRFRYEKLAPRQQMVQPIDNDCFQAWLPFRCFLRYSAMAVKISPFSERLCCFATARICSNREAEIRTVTVFIVSPMQLFYHHCNCMSSDRALSSLPPFRGGYSRASL